MRLKWAIAISARWPSVNGAGGNTSSAEAALGFEAAIGPDAMYERQLVADLFLRNLEHATLLVERAR